MAEIDSLIAPALTSAPDMGSARLADDASMQQFDALQQEQKRQQDRDLAKKSLDQNQIYTLYPDLASADQKAKGTSDAASVMLNLSYRLNKPLDEVRQNFQMLRTGYAQAQGWDVASSDSVFKTKFQEQFQKEDDQQKAIQNLQSKALQDSVSYAGKGMSRNPLAAFSEWDKEHGAMFGDATEAQKLKVFNETYLPVQKQMSSPVGIKAAQLVDALTKNADAAGIPEVGADKTVAGMEQGQDVPVQPKKIDPVQFIKGMSGEDQDKVLGLAAQLMATRQPEMGNGMKVAGGLGQAFAQGFLSYNAINQIDDLVDAEKRLKAAQTPEDAQKAKDDIENIKLAQKIKQAEQMGNTVQPELYGLPKFAYEAAQGVASMPGVVAPAVIPVLGEFAFYKLAQAQDAMKLMAQNPGMTAEEAKSKVTIASAAYGITMGRLAAIFGEASPGLGGFLKHTLQGTLVMEGAEAERILGRQLQSEIDPSFNPNEDYGTEWLDLLKSTPKNFVTLAAFGGIVKLIQGERPVDPNSAAELEKQAGNSRLLQYLGFTQETAEKVAGLKEGQRLKALAGEWGNRTQEQKQAGVELAREDAAKADQTLASPDAPKIEQTPDGKYAVTTKDGDQTHTAVFETEEGARQALQLELQFHEEKNASTEPTNDWVTSTEEKPNATAPSPVNEVDTRINDVSSRLGQEFGGTLPSSVEVVHEPDANWNAKIEGGKIKMNAAHVGPEQAVHEMNEELSHAAWGESGVQDLFQQLWDSADQTLKDSITQLVERLYGDQSADIQHEETRAKLVKEILKLRDNPESKGAWDKFVEAIKAIWEKLTGAPVTDPEAIAAKIIEIGKAKIEGEQGVKLYRGTQEGGEPYGFKGKFYSKNRKAAEQYGSNIEESTLPADAKILTPDNAEFASILKDFEQSNPDDAMFLNESPEVDGFMFPSEDWVNYLQSKGYDGTSIGKDAEDVFLFDKNSQTSFSIRARDDASAQKKSFVASDYLSSIKGKKIETPDSEFFSSATIHAIKRSGQSGSFYGSITFEVPEENWDSLNKRASREAEDTWESDPDDGEPGEVTVRFRISDHASTESAKSSPHIDLRVGKKSDPKFGVFDGADSVFPSWVEAAVNVVREAQSFFGDKGLAETLEKKNPFPVSQEGADQNGASPFARSESNLGQRPGEGIGLNGNESELSPDVNTSFSIRARDEAYDSAVKSGDMETAQRLVNETRDEFISTHPQAISMTSDAWSKAWNAQKRKDLVLQQFKEGIIKHLIGQAKSEGWNWGWKLDPKANHRFKWVAYFDTPAGQISFHTRIPFDALDQLHPIQERLRAEINELDQEAKRFKSKTGNKEFAANKNKSKFLHEQLDDAETLVSTDHPYQGSWDGSKGTQGDRLGKLNAGSGGVPPSAPTESQPMGGRFVVRDLEQHDTIKSLVKLSDAVTYDDAGNVIPLSQRFNPESNDIRFSKKTPAPIIGAIPPPKTMREQAAEIASRVASTVRDLPKDSAFKRHLLQWSARSQASSDEVMRVQHTIETTIKDKAKRDGITNWIEAGGDRALLLQRAAASKEPKIKAGYEAAAKFTTEEIKVAEKVRDTFNILEARAKKWGIDMGHRENYVPHVYLQEPQLPSGSSPKRLSEFFKFSQKRTFESYFGGEQAGYHPQTKDISKLLGLYLNDMNNAINSRRFVAELSKGKASDGRPLVSPRGSGIAKKGESGESEVHLVYPDAAQEGHEDYKIIDQPALHDWSFAGKDENGKNIMVKGDLAVHPEIALRFSNVLGSSAIRKWWNAKTENPFLNFTKGTAKFLLDDFQSIVKGTMLSFSPFHQVQEGIHAIGHRVNPFANIPKIDLRDPKQADAAAHGLMLSHDRLSQSLFMEGVGTNNRNLVTMVLRKIGWGLTTAAADKVDSYQHWLFSQYIPGLKLKTYEHILERNMERFKADIAAGKATEFQVKNLSAHQANAAYGHLNYTEMGHNPTIRHAFQIVLLAPDFLEARSRFVAQSLKSLTGTKTGIEQLQAFAFLAATQVVAATIQKVLTNGDPEWDHPFEMRVGNKYYGMRSVPEDVFKMLHNPTGFIGGRISPIFGRFIQEGVFGVNYRGERTSVGDAIADIMAGIVPMPMQSLTRQWTTGGKANPISPLEQILSSAGVQVHRYSPITKVYPLAHDWVKKNYPEDVQRGSYPVSKYQQLRYALEDNNTEAANREIDRLVDGGMKRGDIGKGFKESVNHPFTGSKTHDQEFYKSLDEDDKKRYDAAVERRKEILRRFMSVGH